MKTVERKVVRAFAAREATLKVEDVLVVGLRKEDGGV